MIRIAALLIALAAPAAAYDDAELLALCEPAVIAEDPDLLTSDQWRQVDALEAEFANGTGRLWRITSPGGAVSHLWGTLHSADPRISNVPEALKLLIADARIMITEQTGTEATLQEVREWRNGSRFYSYMPKQYREKLPPQAMAAIESRLRDFGFSAADVDTISRLGLLSILLGDPCGDRWSITGYPIQDTRVELLAADQAIALMAADRRQVLDDFVAEPRWQEAFWATATFYALLQTTPEAASTMMRSYLDGRIGRMMAIDRIYLQHRYPEMDIQQIEAQMNDFLLRYRNERMVDQVLPELNAGGAVMAVGAYHLPLDFGLISLLRDEGFDVKRIALPGEAN